MTDGAECPICGDEDHDWDAHELVFHVDDRRPPDDYAPDICAELLAYGVIHGPHGDYYPSGWGPILELDLDSRMARDALRWAENVGDDDRVIEYSQVLTNLCDEIESAMTDVGLIGGFEPDVGGFLAYTAAPQ